MDRYLVLIGLYALSAAFVAVATSFLDRISRGTRLGPITRISLYAALFAATLVAYFLIFQTDWGWIPAVAALAVAIPVQRGVPFFRFGMTVPAICLVLAIPIGAAAAGRHYYQRASAGTSTAASEAKHAIDARLAAQVEAGTIWATNVETSFDACAAAFSLCVMANGQGRVVSSKPESAMPQGTVLGAVLPWVTNLEQGSSIKGLGSLVAPEPYLLSVSRSIDGYVITGTAADAAYLKTLSSSQGVSLALVDTSGTLGASGNGHIFASQAVSHMYKGDAPGRRRIISGGNAYVAASVGGTKIDGGRYTLAALTELTPWLP